MLSFFPRDVLDEILNLIESVSEGFPTYSCHKTQRPACAMSGKNVLFLRPHATCTFCKNLKMSCGVIQMILKGEINESPMLEERRQAMTQNQNIIGNSH